MWEIVGDHYRHTHYTQYELTATPARDGGYVFVLWNTETAWSHVFSDDIARGGLYPVFDVADEYVMKIEGEEVIACG